MRVMILRMVAMTLVRSTWRYTDVGKTLFTRGACSNTWVGARSDARVGAGTMSLFFRILSKAH